MHLTDLDMDLLRAFVTVYETRSFTRASEKLFRTQSAVSLRIRRLEDLVGKRLIERGHHDLKLTAHGLELYRYAKLMLRLNDRAVLRICDADRKRDISIGLPESFAPTLLPPLWQAVERFFPNSPVSIVCDVSAKLRTMFRDGDVDIAILAEPPDPENSATIFIDDLRWVCAPGTRFDQHDVLPMVLFPEGCLFRESGLAALQSANLHFQIVTSSRNFRVIETAVLHRAVTIFAEHTIPHDLEVAVGDLPSLPQIGVAFYCSLEHANEIQTMLREKLAAYSATRTPRAPAAGETSARAPGSPRVAAVSEVSGTAAQIVVSPNADQSSVERIAPSMQARARTHLE
jgi:DNA-binding transcriptional LysR family regulator